MNMHLKLNPEHDYLDCRATAPLQFAGCFRNTDSRAKLISSHSFQTIWSNQNVWWHACLQDDPDPGYHSPKVTHVSTTFPQAISLPYPPSSLNSHTTTPKPSTPTSLQAASTVPELARGNKKSEVLFPSLKPVSGDTLAKNNSAGGTQEASEEAEAKSQSSFSILRKQVRAQRVVLQDYHDWMGAAHAHESSREVRKWEGICRSNQPLRRSFTPVRSSQHAGLCWWMVAEVYLMHLLMAGWFLKIAIFPYRVCYLHYIRATLKLLWSPHVTCRFRALSELFWMYVCAQFMMHPWQSITRYNKVSTNSMWGVMVHFRNTEQEK